MKLRFAVASAVVILWGCGADLRDRTDPFSKTGELIAWSGGGAGAANACHVCHGLDGGGNGAGAPRLAGLPQGYLVKQLGDYADGLRQDEVMGPIARRLSAMEHQMVAEWYAEIPFPDNRSLTGSHSPEASQLWRYGDPSRGVGACSACHGVSGEGAGAGGPPLHDQPPAYLAEQLYRWRRGERQNDPAYVMIEVSRPLRDEEIEALASYAAALPGPSAAEVQEMEP